jgi:predicted secreted protein
MAKIAGTLTYVEVNTGTYGSPVWTKVGGQKDASWSWGLEEIDTTDKDSAGWKERLPANREVSIDFDCFLIEDNAGLVEMKKGFWDATPKQLDLRLKTPSYVYRGYFQLGEGSGEAPLDDAVTIAFSMKSTAVVTEAAA